MRIICAVVLLITMLCVSCNSLDRDLSGDWVIDYVQVQEVPGALNLYSNGFSLNEDHSCYLPIADWADRHTEKQRGKWRIFSQSDSVFLQIETKNHLFNRTFLVEDLRKEKDPVSGGDLTRMKLIADSLILECTGIAYK
jgi:hypothetical protein